MSANHPTRGQLSTTVGVGLAIAALVTVVAVGAGSFGSTPDASPTPTAQPSVVPTPGHPSHAPMPTGSPVTGPQDGSGVVKLHTATDHEVSVVIEDGAGVVVDAASGHPGDGMSVRWFDSIVENVDPTTIRVTWVGLPGDEVINLRVSEDGSAVALAFTQAAPPAYSDAVGFDRILVLTFDTPVSADDVVVSFAEAAS